MREEQDKQESERPSVADDQDGTRRRSLGKPRVERRSATRPNFVQGWRKAMPRRRGSEQSAVAAEPVARVDIWVANPDELLRAESCLQVLSEDDWASSNEIQDPSKRRSSIAAKVLLRIGLSRSAGHKIAPSQWRFESTANNKPTVAAGLPAINFSVSHVDELVAIAVSPTLEVGVDVECVDQNVSKNLIANFCHFDEQHAVGGLPDFQEAREFIRFWTLKEAYTKVMGLGHALDFKMLKFTLDPLELKAGGDDSKRSMQFDNFYVSYKHSLFLASLAIRHPAQEPAVSTEVQIISLAKPDGNDAAHAAPLCA